MSFPTFTSAPQVKANLYTIAKDTVFAADANVGVYLGHPGMVDPDQDMVLFLDVHATQDPATLANRSRDETVELDVMFSSFIAGQDDDSAATARVYALVGQLEQYCRVTDPTLGGAVLWCFLTEHQSKGATAPESLPGGRLIYVLARFTARARISN